MILSFKAELFNIGAEGQIYLGGLFGVLVALAIPGVPSWIGIPYLEDIPVLGMVLFGQDPLAYLLFALIFFGGWWLFRTNTGLQLRSVGENPRAADAAGVPVFLTQHSCDYSLLLRKSPIRYS